MKKLLFLLAVISVITVGARAQTKEENQVAAAVETMRLAMISGKQPDLENIAATDLSYGHSSGKIQNKAEFVAAIVNKQSVFVSITLSGQTIRVTGSTAIVRHKFDAVTNDGGKPGTTTLGIVLVFVKQHDQWKLLARQAYKLPV